jgi:hypothetical protein
MRERPTIFRVLLPLALLLGMPLTASAAAAAPRVDVEPIPSCPITVGGHLGAMKCDTVMLSHTYLSGRLEYFVVGTTATNNIYHIYQLPSDHSTWSNWMPVPGNGVAVTGVLPVPWMSPFTIEVQGTTGGWYCNTIQSGPTGWSGWYSC